MVNNVCEWIGVASYYGVYILRLKLKLHFIYFKFGIVVILIPQI